MSMLKMKSRTFVEAVDLNAETLFGDSGETYLIIKYVKFKHNFNPSNFDLKIYYTFKPVYDHFLYYTFSSHQL